MFSACLPVHVGIAGVLMVPPVIVKVVGGRTEAEEAREVHHGVVEPAGLEGGPVNRLVQRHEVEGHDKRHKQHAKPSYGPKIQRVAKNRNSCAQHPTSPVPCKLSQSLEI